MAINTFAPLHRKPALVIVDSKAAKCRRYWPKADRGFLVDEVDILPDAELGTPDGRFQVESFRLNGLRTVRPAPDTTPRAA